MPFILAVKIIAAVAAAAVCAKALEQLRHPFCMALLNAAGGVSALGAVNLFAQYTGVSIALNYGTSFVAAVLGVPGVIALTALRPFLL